MKTPLEINLRSASRLLELSYEDGSVLSFPFEFLRVYSPSAEVRGHGVGQETLQVGKRDVQIETIEPVGHYAIRPNFSDGHTSGIYSWDYLLELGANQQALWDDYLSRLDEAGASRDGGDPRNAPYAAAEGRVCGSH